METQNSYTDMFAPTMDELQGNGAWILKKTT
jgi:hypothetical protein